MRSLGFLTLCLILVVSAVTARPSPLAFGAERPLNAPRIAPSTDVTGVKIAANADIFLVVWRDAATSGLLARRLSSEGEILDHAPIEIGIVAKPWGFDVAEAGDGFVVMVQHYRGLFEPEQGFYLTRVPAFGPYHPNSSFIASTDSHRPSWIREIDDGFVLANVSLSGTEIRLLDENLQPREAFSIVPALTPFPGFDAHGDEIVMVEASSDERSVVLRVSNLRGPLLMERFDLQFRARNVVRTADGFAVGGVKGSVHTGFHTIEVAFLTEGGMSPSRTLVFDPSGLGAEMFAATASELVVVWQTAGGPFVAGDLLAGRFTSSGEPLGSSVLVWNFSPNDFNNPQFGSVAGGSHASLAAWTEGEGGPGTSSLHVVAAKVTGGSERPARTLVSTRLATQLVHDAVPFGDGVLVITSEETLRPDFLREWALWGTLVTAEGELFRELTLPATPLPRGHGVWNARAAPRSGGALVAWQHARTDGSRAIMASHIRSDGTASPPFMIAERGMLADLSCNDSGTCVAIVSDDRIDTGSDNGDEIYAVRIGPDGSVGELVFVRIPRSGRAAGIPVIASDGISFVVVWQETTGPIHFIVRATISVFHTSLDVDVHDMLASAQLYRGVAIAWTGTDYLVATTRSTTVVTTRLSAEGHSLDGGESGWEGIPVFELAESLPVVSIASNGAAHQVVVGEEARGEVLVLDRSARTAVAAGIGRRGVVTALRGGSFLVAYSEAHFGDLHGRARFRMTIDARRRPASR